MFTNSLRIRQDSKKRSMDDWHYETFLPLLFSREPPHTRKEGMTTCMLLVLYMYQWSFSNIFFIILNISLLHISFLVIIYNIISLHLQCFDTVVGRQEAIQPVMSVTLQQSQWFSKQDLSGIWHTSNTWWLEKIFQLNNNQDLNYYLLSYSVKFKAFHCS